MREIKFKGKDYILTDDSGGAIATKEQYQNGEQSYAHFFSDGRVMRFGEQIGTKEDIEFGKEIDLEIKASMTEMVANFLGEIKEKWG